MTYLRLHTILPALHPVDEFRAASWISDAPLVRLRRGGRSCAVRRRARAGGASLLPALALGALALRSRPLRRRLRALRGARARRRPRAPRARARAARSAARPRASSRRCCSRSRSAPRVAAARAGRSFVDVGLDGSALPLDALRFVDDNGLRERMYNDFEIGSYLLFEGYPRHRVFVDPRLPAYPPELHALLGRGDLSRARVGRGDAALRRRQRAARLRGPQPARELVGSGDAGPSSTARTMRACSCAGCRASRRSSPRARSRRRSPSRSREGTETVPLARARRPPHPSPNASGSAGSASSSSSSRARARAGARAAYERALASPPGCLAPADERRLAAWMGALALGEGHAPAALARLERALALGDAELPTRVNRAVALERVGRAAEAAAAWDESPRAPPTPPSSSAPAPAPPPRAADSIPRADGFPGRGEGAAAVARAQVDGPRPRARARLQIAEAPREAALVRLEQRRRAREVEVEPRAVGGVEGRVEAGRERVESGRARRDEAPRGRPTRGQTSSSRATQPASCAVLAVRPGSRSSATTPVASAGSPRGARASVPKATRAADPRRAVNPCCAIVSVSSVITPLVVAVSTGSPSATRRRRSSRSAGRRTGS